MPACFSELGAISETKLDAAMELSVLFLTLDDGARLLERSPDTLYRAITAGMLPARVCREDLGPHRAGDLMVNALDLAGALCRLRRSRANRMRTFGAHLRSLHAWHRAVLTALEQHAPGSRGGVALAPLVAAVSEARSPAGGPSEALAWANPEGRLAWLLSRAGYRERDGEYRPRRGLGRLPRAQLVALLMVV